MIYERIIEGYIHNGRIGVMVEFAAETEYTFRTDAFKSLAKDVAMHIAASSPSSVASLLEQPFVKEQERTVGQLLKSASSIFRESITVRRFIRWDTSETEEPHPEPPRNPAVAVRIPKRA